MARLPVPGSDDGTWGNILNDYLSTQHNSDGTHNLGLNDLSDVNTSGAINGQVLKYNGTMWVVGNDDSGAGDPPVGGDLSGTASNAQIIAGAIADTEVAAGANIAQSKIANLASDLSGKQPLDADLTAIAGLTPSNDDILQRKAGAWANRTPVQVKADLALTKSDVGLANADNTSDANKPISTAAQTALDAKADETITISGTTSLTGGGDLSANRTITLVNDSGAPGNSRYYGTDGAGTKGFHAITSGDPAMGGDISGTASNAQIVASAITDTEVSASAAIAQSKISGLVSDLASKVDDSEKGAASGVATLDGGTKVPITQLPDATTLAKGIVQLAGDLAGTAVSPTVPGLAAKINNSEKGAPNGVAQLDGSGKIIPGQLVTSNITKLLPYSYTGTLAIYSGPYRLYNDMGTAWTITSIRASVGTAPTGASVIIDVNKNGTTIFTTQANRPTITAGNNTTGSVTNMNVTSVAVGEYLTVDIDQVGSTVAGADLVVQVEVV